LKSLSGDISNKDDLAEAIRTVSILCVWPSISYF
jgi:hypothetical protein